MFTAASRYLRRSTTTSFRTTTTTTTLTSTNMNMMQGVRSMSSLAEQFKEYGKMVFTGKVADGYLQSYGASAELLKDPTWVNHSSDIVASAVFDWYVRLDEYRIEAFCVCSVYTVGRNKVDGGVCTGIVIQCIHW